jgi:hypothetical protein
LIKKFILYRVNSSKQIMKNDIMNSNSSVKVERLSVQLNDEHLKDVSGGLYSFPTYPFRPVLDRVVDWTKDLGRFVPMLK